MKLFLTAVFAAKAAATANWDELEEKTCVLGMAASSMPGAATVQTSLLQSTIEECKAACVKFAGCEGVAFDAAAGGKGGCSFLSHISPDKCTQSVGPTSTYVLTSSFEDHPDTDCLVGVAAQTMPGVSEPAEMATSVSSCQNKCVATAGCKAAVVRSEDCFLRQGVSVEKCHALPGAELYVLLASRKEEALVQAWQQHALGLHARLTGPVLGAGFGFVFMGAAIAAVAWRGRKQRGLRDSGEDEMSLSLAEVAEDSI